MSSRRVFVGPRLQDGVHVMVNEHVRAWAKDRNLHESNIEDHIVNPASDQKCNGWRLIERLRWLQHISHGEWIIPALGTADALVQACAEAADDRRKLKSQKSVRMLLGNYGKFQNGKPYNNWRLYNLDPREAEARMRRLVQISAAGQDALSLDAAKQISQECEQVSARCAHAARPAAPALFGGDISGVRGSFEVRFGAFEPRAPRARARPNRVSNRSDGDERGRVDDPASLPCAQAARPAAPALFGGDISGVRGSFEVRLCCR